MKELNEIQCSLVALKSEYNSFGKYAYRTAESIFFNLKPLLAKLHCEVIVSEDIVLIGERYFLKSTSTLKNEKGEQVSATAFAEIPSEKKGMDLSQITGSVSSYAKKYSLSNLFAIDSCTDNDKVEQIKASSVDKDTAIAELKKTTTLAELGAAWDKYKRTFGKDKIFLAVKEEMKKTLSNGDK